MTRSKKKTECELDEHLGYIKTLTSSDMLRYAGILFNGFAERAKDPTSFVCAALGNRALELSRVMGTSSFPVPEHWEHLTR